MTTNEKVVTVTKKIEDIDAVNDMVDMIVSFTDFFADEVKQQILADATKGSAKDIGDTAVNYVRMAAIAAIGNIYYMHGIDIMFEGKEQFLEAVKHQLELFGREREADPNTN